MKTTKLIAGTIAVMLFSNFLIAGSPNDGQTKKLANNLLNHLSQDIVLTDTQKIIIQTRADEFEVKLQDLSNKSDQETKKKLKSEAMKRYSVVFDSVLTVEQCDTLRSKQMERIITEINSYKTKK